MSFVEQVYNRLEKLKESGMTREEVEQEFDKVCKDVLDSNMDFVASLGRHDNYTKRGRYLRDSMFDEVHESIKLKEIEESIKL